MLCLFPPPLLLEWSDTLVSWTKVPLFISNEIISKPCFTFSTYFIITTKRYSVFVKISLQKLHKAFF